MRVISLLLCALVLATASSFAQTTTLSAQTSNNTAACAAAGSPSYCQAGWKGLSDSTSGTYDPVPGNASSGSISPLLYPGNVTKLFAYVMPWFCMSSSATGLGTMCNNHLQVGYNSNDSATVNGQASDMIRRGFGGVVIDWYGPTLGFPYDQVSQKFRDNLNGRCGGPQSCPLLLALMEDQGSFLWSGGPTGNGCPQNNGVDQTNCILGKLESDLDYMNAHYFNTNSYLRVDNTPGSPTYMQATPTGKPTVLFFICEECWSNATWTTIWNSLRTHTNQYASGGIAMFFIFRNSPAFSHVQTNGGFAWVNWYGTDPYGLNYLADFYNTATSAVNLNPTLLTFGGGWKGFDETNAPWASGSARIIGQQCGNTWLQTIQKANSYYSGSRQLPFFGAVTWNDYEEGTEIETGIDNCLTLTASLSGSTLSWTPTFSSSGGSESTITGYTVYRSSDGTNLTTLSTVPPGTHSLNLGSFTLPNGTYSMYVQAVGQSSILNHISNAVSYTVGTTATTGTISGRVTDISTGAAISGATVSYGSTSTTTNSTGSYAFTNVAPGSYSVTASSTGYASATQSVTVTAGATSTVNFQLAATGAIGGTVRNTNGRAINNAVVTITGGVIATTVTRTTNGAGKYNSGTIPMGTYTITVSKTGYTTQSKTATVSKGTTSTVDFTLQ